tara:strand:+ start:1254 stop:1430 length:177 start_codon:yes stop_codon:yes gene_type:complete
MEVILNEADYREFTQRVDIASSKGVDVPHMVETIGDKFKITLLEKIDVDLLDKITEAQ